MAAITQPFVGTRWTASGIATTTAVWRLFLRWRCAHVEPTYSSTNGGTPSPHGLPAPHSPVLPARPPLTIGWFGSQGEVKGTVWYLEDPHPDYPQSVQQPRSPLNCRCLGTNLFQLHKQMGLIPSHLFEELKAEV